MNRDTRDRFAATTDQKDLAYGESACVETPPDFFEKVWEGFGRPATMIDLTANEQNHLMPGWFGPGSPYHEYDALEASWIRYGEIGFSNPPYGDFIPKILKKAVEEASRPGPCAFTSAFLLPMRAGNWYTEIVLRHADYVFHLEPRLTFWWRGQPKPTAKVKVTRKHRADPLFGIDLLEQDGYLYAREGETGSFDPVLQPANALFDSILVIFKPTLALSKLPYTVQPRPWRWKAYPLAPYIR